MFNRPPTLKKVFFLLVTAPMGISSFSLTAVGASQRAPIARTDRTINVTDTAHLHNLNSPGAELIEEGPATGQLPGKVKVEMNVGATVTATFTIATSHGAITGKGTGQLHSSGQYASFGGTMTINHGTGRFAHAHGHGGFYGTINRKTYALVVQTTGSLSY